MTRFTRRWKIRKLDKGSRRLEREIQDKKDIYKEARVRVENLAARMDRNSLRLSTLENKYVENSETVPSKILEAEILALDEEIKRDAEILENERAGLEEVRFSLEGSENDLVINNKELQRLKADYNMEKILRGSKKFGKEVRKSKEEGRTLVEDQANRRSMNDDAKGNIENPLLARLEKTRIEVQNARAAGKSEDEIAELKKQSQ
jgi:hypothetical protein